MWDQTWKSLFIRLAECTGYEYITDDVNLDALMQKQLYSYSMLSTLKSFMPIVLEETEYEEEPLDQYLENLRYLLENREWGKACKKIFIRLSAIKPSAYFVEIQTIDNLWVKYSNYHFGFSVQKRIWEEVGRDFSQSNSRD